MNASECYLYWLFFNYCNKFCIKCATPKQRRPGAHLPRKPVGGNTTVVTSGQCDARPTVTFRADAGTKLMLIGDRGTCLWTICPGLHSTARQPVCEPATCWSQVRPPKCKFLYTHEKLLICILELQSGLVLLRLLRCIIAFWRWYEVSYHDRRLAFRIGVWISLLTTACAGCYSDHVVELTVEKNCSFVSPPFVCLCYVRMCAAQQAAEEETSKAMWSGKHPRRSGA